MTSPSEANSQSHNLDQQKQDIENKVDDLSNLIDMVEQDSSSRPVFTDQLASQLAKARLGIACGLFESIRMKHSPTALHCLRVALGCSVWFDRLAPGFHRDELEIAAMLHDLGKIGVPDEILTKPGHLNVDERKIVEAQWKQGIDVLKTFCKSKETIDCVNHASTWFDGSRNESGLKEEELPLSSRMLAIADAFDSMTTDQVYRKALSLDRRLPNFLKMPALSLIRNSSSHLPKTLLPTGSISKWNVARDGLSSRLMNPSRSHCGRWQVS